MMASAEDEFYVKTLQELADNAETSARESADDLRSLYHQGRHDGFLAAIEVIQHPDEF